MCIALDLSMTVSDRIGFFLLAMISLSLFATIKWSLPDRPDIQERLVKALLIPLAIADVSVLKWSEIRCSWADVTAVSVRCCYFTPMAARLTR